MNDDFCDSCLIFKGHEDMHSAHTPVGTFLICDDCKSKIDKMSKKETKEFFLNLAKSQEIE